MCGEPSSPPLLAGKHSNTSQFYITLAPAPQCDQKHVVLGRVVQGLEVLREIGEQALFGTGVPSHLHPRRPTTLCH